MNLTEWLAAGKPLNSVINADCLIGMKELPDNSVDLILTDPPYGLEFMGNDWDKAVPSVNIWKECLRILKDGSFAFIMSSPRLDVLSQMAIRLQEAGFQVNFTPIYWAYASGFPKAGNISKLIDKRLDIEQEKIEYEHPMRKNRSANFTIGFSEAKERKTESGSKIMKGIATSEQAKLLDGSYAGFQPKPAVEVIIVAMKPLSEKTYMEQALKNRKGISWLDDCRIPFDKGDVPVGGYGNMDIGIGKPLEHQTYRKPDSIIAKNPHTMSKGTDAYDVNCYGKYNAVKTPIDYTNSKGRFPANLLVSDDVLNDGISGQSIGHNPNVKTTGFGKFGGGTSERVDYKEDTYIEDSGSFSRYFDLDMWFSEQIKKLPKEVQDVFPFLIVPKASGSEKNKGCENLPEVQRCYMSVESRVSECINPSKGMERFVAINRNFHPTVKPLKIISYLITLGSRNDDLILDPFLGSGTTAVACKMLNRRFIGIEKEEKYCEIARKRIANVPKRLDKFVK